MADNTRVNELQDKLLQAMDILNAQALSTISFDKTILCVIEDDSNKAEGKYIVNDGVKTFAAYSSDTKLRTKDNVYVTIPQGNFENQKMIIGKKIDDTDKPFTFTTPFDTIFDMTDNIVAGKVINGSLVANALNKYGNENYEYITLYNETCNYYGFNRLGLKANFKSWIKNSVRGEYGITIILNVKNPNIASSQQIEEQEYYYTFSNKEMYGNSYDFETDYEQQIIIPLDKIKGTITNITINFYQKANFFDRFNKPIPCSQLGYKLKDNDSNQYDKDEDGDYILNEDDIILEPNIFVNNIYLCLGYDISIFKEDMVELYTQQSTTYKHSNDLNNNNSNQNKKNIKIRWVHIDDGVPVDMVAAADKEQSDVPYEVRWYRYKVGASAADPFCGVYWTRIEDAVGFSYMFNPDIDLQQEKIKVIIIYNSNTPYRSNELLFENEQVLPPSQEAIHIQNALTISTDDNTNGNYMIYGQDNSIKDTEYGNISRSMTAWFDANSNGEIEANEKINEDQALNLLWTFPAENTMIELLDENKLEVFQGREEERKVVAYQVYTSTPWYKISSYYSPNKTNNTITCQYTLNNRVYTTEKEFTFGPAGTMGTDQTLVIDFAGDTKSLNKSATPESAVIFEVQLYNNQNVLQTIPDQTVTWAWYYNSELDNGKNIFPYVISDQKDSKILFKNEDFDINHLYILQATVGSLTTYFSIPIQRGGFSHIKGPTQVIYQANGEPAYNRDSYTLYQNNDETLIKTEWIIKHNITDTDEEVMKKKLKFIGQINDQNKLQPLSIYTKDAPVYGVQAITGNEVLWTQPILVLQNQWPNGVINAWDGKSLVLDEEESMIIAAAIAAGKKNSKDNTFSGVMLGDWSGKDAEGSLTQQTGVYGFHHGAMSYAFKEDGTAFLGKDGKGRINFDGNHATIYSPYYKTGSGMMIDLGGDNNPYIDMKCDDNKYIKMDFVDSTPRLTVQSGDSYFLLDTKNNASKIYLKGSKGEKAGAITLSTQSSDDPLTIGDKFHIEWDGTLYANGGFFKGTLNAEEGYLNNLEVTGNLSVYMDNWDTGRKGPIFLYNTNETQMGYMGFLNGDDGTNQTNNIGIKSLNGHGIVFESNTNVRLSATHGIYIDASNIHFTADADNQHGIYARFA